MSQSEIRKLVTGSKPAFDELWWYAYRVLPTVADNNAIPELVSSLLTNSARDPSSPFKAAGTRRGYGWSVAY